MHQKLTDKSRERKTHSWGLEDPVSNNVQKVVVHHIFLVNSLVLHFSRRLSMSAQKQALIHSSEAHCWPQWMKRASGCRFLPMSTLIRSALASPTLSTISLRIDMTWSTKMVLCCSRGAKTLPSAPNTSRMRLPVAKKVPISKPATRYNNTNYEDAHAQVHILKEDWKELWGQIDAKCVAGNDLHRHPRLTSKVTTLAMNFLTSTEGFSSMIPTQTGI